VKYTYQYEPFHAAGQYSDGGEETGFFGPAWGVDAGVTYRGVSIDGVFQRVNAGALVTANNSTTGVPVNSPPIINANSFTTVKAQITDGESWSVQGKYGFDIGGGLKDEESADKLTLYAGYENISNFNSNSARSSQFAGQTVAGGYKIGAFSTNSFLSPRIWQVAWAGVKYELPSGLSFTAAYYHLEQNHYNGSATAPQQGAPNQQAGNAAGSFDDGSFVVDYRFDKHFDIYAGVNYSTIDGGLASGFLANNCTSLVTGMRLKF
jgi:hypothetical protein